MSKLNGTVLFISLLLSGCDTSSLINDNVTSQIENITDNIPSDASTKTNNPQDAVNRHNEIRKEVFQENSVVWSDIVATTAQEYANYLASTGKFEHDSSGYGENIYASSANDSYIDAINYWYKEKPNYNISDNSCNGVCGHYTQIIWKNTTEIGCGKATYTKGDFKGGTIIVCRYNPAGNYIGEKPY